MTRKLAKTSGAELAPTTPADGDELARAATNLVKAAKAPLARRVREWSSGTWDTLKKLGKFTLALFLGWSIYAILATAWFILRSEEIHKVLYLVPELAAIGFMVWLVGQLSEKAGKFAKGIMAVLILAFILSGSVSILSRQAGGQDVNPLQIVAGLAGRINEYDAGKQASKVSQLRYELATTKMDRNTAHESASYERQETNKARAEVERLKAELDQFKNDPQRVVGVVCREPIWLQSGCIYLRPGNEKWPTVLDLRDKYGFGWDMKMPGWASAADGWAVVGECENGQGECWRIQQGERQLGGPNDQPSMWVRLKPLK